LLKKNTFGQPLFIKKTIIRIFCFITHSRFQKINKPDIKGAELFNNLPDKNVLFVSNHQTYFADVAFMIHAIETAKYGFPNQLKLKAMLKCPFIDFYYVAAEETMKSGFLPKILALTGAISIKRTWREAGKEIHRNVDQNDTENIKKALENGWVITFPQGTTKPFAQGRKGTAHIIKDYKPIVVPLIVNGFRDAFDKKGLFINKKGTVLSLTVKQPLEINYEDNVENILSQIMDNIEQSEKFSKNFQF